MVSVPKRPVLCALARALAEGCPGDVPRNTLIARAFGSKLADESHRARLRVEAGRLRTVLRTLADVSAPKRGFGLALGGAVSGPEDRSSRSPNRADSSHDRVQPLRHRGHLDRRRALARHLGR